MTASVVQRIRLTLDDTYFRVDAGGAAAMTSLTVSNDTSLVDELRLRVDGLDREWVSLSESVVRLFPGTAARVELTVRVPAGTLAGTESFGVVATSGRDPSLTAAATATLDIPAFGDVEMTATPQRISGRRRAVGRIALHNGRNAHTPIRLLVVDPDRLMRFDVQPADLVLSPGAAAEAVVDVRLPRPQLTGYPRYRAYLISAVLADDPLETPLAGAGVQVLQLPLIPWFVGLVAMLRQWAMLGVILLIAAGIGIWYLGAPGERTAPDIAQAPGPGPTDGSADSQAAGGSGSGQAAGALAVAAAGQSGSASQASLAAAAGTRDSATAGLLGGAGPSAVGQPTPTPATALIARFGLVGPSEEPPAAVPLRWDVRGADSVRMEPVPPAAAADSYETLERRDYTLTASNPRGTSTEVITVYIVRPPGIESFTADHEAIVAGESVYLLWRTARAETVTLDDVPVDLLEFGSATVQPTETHTYVLRAENTAGHVEQSITVEVAPPPTPTPTPSPTVRPTPSPTVRLIR